MSIFPCSDVVLLQTKNLRSSFQTLSLISWTNYTISSTGGYWLRRDSNTQPSDMESDALTLRHEVLQKSSRTVIRSVFFFTAFIFVFQECLSFLEMTYFNLKNKSRLSFQTLSLISWKNYKVFSVGGNWLRRDSNTQPSDLESVTLPLHYEVLYRNEPYLCATKSSKTSSRTVRDRFFFLPVLIFSSFICVYFPLNWPSFTWNKKIPIKFPGPFLNLLKKLHIF